MPYAIARKVFILEQTITYKILKVYDEAEEVEDLLPEISKWAKELNIPESHLIIVYSD